VNEFAIQQFTQAVAGQLTKVLATSVPGYKASQVAPYEGTIGSRENGAAKHGSRRPPRRDKDLSEKDKNEAGASIVLTGEKGTVISVSKRYGLPAFPIYVLLASSYIILTCMKGF